MKVSRYGFDAHSALSLVFLVTSSAVTFAACGSESKSDGGEDASMGGPLDSGSTSDDAGSGGPIDSGAGADDAAGGDAAIDADACTPGTNEACYDGPDNTAGIGACVAGTRACLPDGSGFGPCLGQVLPIAEACDTIGDDDCDDEVNEGCACTPGSTMSCYGGAEETSGVGECKLGTATCNAAGSGYGECEGDVTPAAETCDLPGDEDCDGDPNEEGTGCVCIPDATEPCYSGPEETRGVGACSDGTATCNGQGTQLGACVDDHLPSAEQCNDIVDDDCDGELHNGCVYASCAALPAGAPSGVYTLDLDGAGTLSPLPFYCDMQTDGGGWRMVFKLTAGVAGDANTLWNGGAANDQDSTLLHTGASTVHYVSRTIGAAWTGITAARAHVYDEAGAQRVFVKFDAAGATSTGWFVPERITSSSWTDLASLTPNYCGIAGDGNFGRRFFINHTYGGCENDSGWLVVDSAPDPCSWETSAAAGAPLRITYAPGATLVNWTTGTVGRGKVFAVFVR